jgi:ABC-type lipoprotein release transport system permease subunit
MKSYLSILKIVLHGRSAGKILLATILSFTFSITVILCTFGLMDGFDFLLKSGLRHSSGDVLITNRRGFFSFSDELKDSVSKAKPRAVSPVIQTEAFALKGEKTRGVLIRGIESRDFQVSTGLDVRPETGSVVIGEELAKDLKLNVGDEVALTFGKGNEAGDALPMIKTFAVSGLIRHGIYQKDLRLLYMKRTELSELLELGDRINLLLLSFAPMEKPLENLELVQRARDKLRSELDSEFVVKPFWSEYSFLIEAVKVEKFSISLILQLIVVVAVFNIIAFVIFIMEKKAQDFFFLRAIGLSLSSLTRFWLWSVIFMWAFACVGAFFLSHLFNWGLGHLSFLQIPGEIYVLSKLNVRLDFMAHVTVYALSFIWILLAAFVGYIRLKRRPIIEGLRQEFSS